MNKKRRRSRTGFSYFWKEGVHNIFLHGFMSFAAVSIIVAMLLITGSVALISYNIELQIIDLQQQSEIVVFVVEGQTDAEVQEIGDKIRAVSNVAEAEFLPRAEALEQYRVDLGEDAAILEGFDALNNPLRDSYHITMRDASLLEQTAEQIAEIKGLDKPKMNADTVAMLVKLERVFKVISGALVIALGLISIFIISNTVKLAMFSRRDEIAIQKMVGATNWFIRWPFIIEGLLLGLLAGCVAFFAEWGVYAELSKAVTNVLPTFAMAPFGALKWIVLGVFLCAGVVVGVGGSVLTIRRFMDV